MICLQFLGLNNFLKDKNSFVYRYKSTSNKVSSLKLSNGYIYGLYVSSNTSESQYENGMPEKWEVDESNGNFLNITILMANYNDTCNASNFDIDTNSIDSIRIKKRIKNSNDEWYTIYDHPISATTNFNFNFTDYLCKHNCDYQYNIVTVKNGIETYMNNVIDIHSSFDGIYFTDGKEQYGTSFDIESDYSRKTSSSTVQPINSRYPVIIKNGYVNYSTGNVTARLLKIDKNCDVDLNNGYQYRKEIVDFLSESGALVFKNYDGLMAIVSIGDDISEKPSDYYLAPKISFSWTQIGDADDYSDLRDNGLIGGDE